MSGTSCRISSSAEGPSSADRTLCPNSIKSCASDSRTYSSSSTIRNFTLALDILYLLQSIATIFGSTFHRALLFLEC